MIEDARSVRGRFLEANRLGDERVEDVVTEYILDFFANLTSKNGSTIEHGDEDAEHAKLGIWPRFDFVDGLEEVVGSFERKIGSLDRNQNMACGHQRIQGQKTEGWWCVDDDRLEIPAQGLDLVLQPVGRIQLANHLHLEFCHRDARWSDPQIFMSSRREDFVHGHGAAKDVVHVPIEILEIDVGHSGIRLGIEVNEKGLEPLLGEPGGEVDGGGCFPDAALLVGDGDDHEFSELVPQCHEGGPLSL